MGSYLTILTHPALWLHHPFLLALGVFVLWMLIDAGRRGEWIWFFLILIFSGLTAVLYFFLVYRASPVTRGFELPGASDRRRIKELQAQIYHLDKAYLHSQLGDIYFHRGKLEKAEACYRAAMEREPEDLATRAHLGQCLLRLKRPAEARPLLEGVIAENPKHDYGHSMMALAETLSALGETDAALNYWIEVTKAHTYARARVQLAEIYLKKNQTALAHTELKGVVSDDLYAPPFQRKRERVWVRRAKWLLRGL